MVKTLTRTGNSPFLVLDRRILEATGIGADTKLDVLSTDGEVMVVSPLRSERRTARLPKVPDDLVVSVAAGRRSKPGSSRRRSGDRRCGRPFEF